MPQGQFMFLVPVLVYVYMNHPDFQSVADSVNASLSTMPTDTLRSQMRAPFVLSEVLPVGLLGAFAAAKAPKSPTGSTSDRTNGALIWLLNVSVGMVESDAFTESATD